MTKKGVTTAWVLMIVLVLVLMASSIITAERAKAASSASNAVACNKHAVGPSPRVNCPPIAGILRFTVFAEGLNDGDRIWWSAKCSSRDKPYRGSHISHPLFANMVDIDVDSGLKIANVLLSDTCAFTAWASHKDGAKTPIWLSLKVKTRTA